MNFITVDQPGKRSASVQRRAHSHAARVAHARARLSRMADFEQEKKKRSSSNENSNEPWSLVNVSRYKRRKLMIPTTVSGFFEPEPLTSFLRELTSWEKSLFDYYLNEVVPQLQAECVMIIFVDDQPNFIRDWILHSSMDADLLRGVLLTACRHRAMSDSRDEYQRFAMEYKLQQLRVIRKSISDGSLASRRTAVTRAIMLVVDEIYLNDISMASRHVLGVIDIIRASGGANVLGLSGLVRYLICASLYGKRLLAWDPSVSARTELMKEDLIRF